jgi:hypothetical protein
MTVRYLNRVVSGVVETRRIPRNWKVAPGKCYKTFVEFPKFMQGDNVKTCYNLNVCSLSLFFFFFFIVNQLDFRLMKSAPSTLIIECCAALFSIRSALSSHMFPFLLWYNKLYPALHLLISSLLYLGFLHSFCFIVSISQLFKKWWIAKISNTFSRDWLSMGQINTAHPGFDSRWGLIIFFFYICPYRLWGSPSLLSSLYWGIFPWG